MRNMFDNKYCRMLLRLGFALQKLKSSGGAHDVLAIPPALKAQMADVESKSDPDTAQNQMHSNPPEHSDRSNTDKRHIDNET
jgi:hypothetical protein